MKYKMRSMFIVLFFIMYSFCGCNNDSDKITDSESTYIRVLEYFVDSYAYKYRNAYAGEYLDIETKQLIVLVAHKQGTIEFEQEVNELRRQYQYTDAIFKSAEYAYSYIRGLSELIHDLYTNKQDDFNSPWQYLQGWGPINYKNCVEVTFRYLDNDKEEKFLNDIASAIADETEIFEIDSIKNDIRKALSIINSNATIPTDEEITAWGDYEEIREYFYESDYSESFGGAYFDNIQKNLVALITYDENSEEFEEVKKDINKIVQGKNIMFKSVKHSYKYLKRIHYEIEKHRKDKTIEDDSVWSYVNESRIVHKSNYIMVAVPPSFQADGKIECFINDLVDAVHGEDSKADYDYLKIKLKEALYFNFNYNNGGW